MNTQLKTDRWVNYLTIVLGLTVTASALGTITLVLLGRSIPEILLAFGMVACAGLIRLLISPLNQSLFE
jgi:hypothetical protein